MKTPADPQSAPPDLGRKVQPTEPAKPEPRWEPIPGRSGYERLGQDGPVRRVL